MPPMQSAIASGVLTSSGQSTAYSPTKTTKAMQAKYKYLLLMMSRSAYGVSLCFGSVIIICTMIQINAMARAAAKATQGLK